MIAPTKLNTHKVHPEPYSAFTGICYDRDGQPTTHGPYRSYVEDDTGSWARCVRCDNYVNMGMPGEVYQHPPV